MQIIIQKAKILKLNNRENKERFVKLTTKKN